MAGDPPREIKPLIDNHINGFNTQNNELFISVFGDDAVIIDGGQGGHGPSAAYQFRFMSTRPSKPPSGRTRVAQRVVRNR